MTFEQAVDFFIGMLPNKPADRLAIEVPVPSDKRNG
jgi:hypothetical protein